MRYQSSRTQMTGECLENHSEIWNSSSRPGSLWMSMLMERIGRSVNSSLKWLLWDPRESMLLCKTGARMFVLSAPQWTWWSTPTDILLQSRVKESSYSPTGSVILSSQFWRWMGSISNQNLWGLTTSTRILSQVRSAPRPASCMELKRRWSQYGSTAPLTPASRPHCPRDVL